MHMMFEDAVEFNGDITRWEVGHVTNLAGMFSSALRLDRDLSGWCIDPGAFVDEYVQHARALTGADI